MSLPKLRVAVVGTGFGTTVHIPAYQSCEATEVVAVCSATEQRAREAAVRFGIPVWTTDYRTLLGRDDVDAVSIASPPFTHHEMSLAAFAAGKHVLLEKPMAVNTAECREMLDAATRSGLGHMIAFEFRWHPGRLFIHQLLREGYIGQLRHANITLFVGTRGGSLGSPYYNWAARRDMGGGMLPGVGSHYLDALSWWFGDFAGVFGGAYAQIPERLDPTTGENRFASADDGFTLQVRFKQGGWATVTQSMAAPFGPGTRIELYGTEGTLATYYPGFNPAARTPILGGRVGDERLRDLSIPARYFPFEDDRDVRMLPFRLMVDDFAGAVRSNRVVAPTFEDGLRIQQAMEGVFTSMDTGRWVELG